MLFLFVMLILLCYASPMIYDFAFIKSNFNVFLLIFSSFFLNADHIDNKKKIVKKKENSKNNKK